ncbi:MAG TPA: protein kinase [Pyrinomonadaceae bacterium]|nr:protein kinase [Pyrinomonadaceae bacterium]
MAEANWQKLREVFDGALQLEPDERQSFISQACGEDKELLEEVESLLSSLAQSEVFLETPAVAHVADVIGLEIRKIEAGTRLGHYLIIRQIGSGGMGEVYLAQDEKLDRHVAVKILSKEFSGRQANLHRFVQEAKAASALNHPNILIIHEIGAANDANYIVSEFIQGKTLREILKEKKLTLSEVLDASIQIANALTAAQEALLIHRDIKPENIMLRSDGLVKVLDFGLAKLAPQESRREADAPAASSMENTNPGMIMGTVRYMSPEQARGLAVDSRTDMWSLGVVLYEMITGRVPFEGATSSHVIVSILEDEPPPLCDYANVPAELERIVVKALAKERDQRYQKANELALDLQNLKQELQSDERLHKSLEPGTRTGASVAETQRRPFGAPAESSATTVRLRSIKLSFSPAYLVNKFRSNKKGALITMTLVLVAVGITFGVFTSIARRNRSLVVPAKPFQSIELLRLTATGRVRDAAVSLDGKYLAYVAESAGKESIWLRDVATSNNVEIVPPTDVEHFGETFSPDSAFVYYLTKERNNTIAALNRVSAHGGSPPVKLIVDVDAPVSFSPDGKQLAYVRGSSTGERALLIANADGTGERKLVSRTGYHAFSFGGPAWSPDGKSIATGAAITDPTGRVWTLVAVNINDGSITPLTTQRWKSVGRVLWLKDGNGMVFSATGLERSATSQLWYMSYPGAEVQRITRDLQDYHGVTLTSDSKTLISKQAQTLSSLWIVPNGDAKLALKILSHKEDDAYFYYYRTRFSWTPSGQIIYTAIVSGNPSIWMMSPEGTGNKQVSSNPSDDSFPSMTADGRHIIFVSDAAGFLNVWRMDSNGRNKKQLTSGEDESWAWSSPDGRWVVYHSGKLGQRSLWRVPIEGGKAEQLTEYPSICPVVSPDGKWISAYYRPETKAPWKLAIIPFDGGQPEKTFEIPQNVAFQSLVRWTPDGNSLAYIMNREGISNIWIQPLDGGPAAQLTYFTTDQIFWFEWSPDGRQLGVSRGTLTSDVVQIRDVVKGH